ncbi:hypothetical protein [Nocardia spumae]|uniref:hypothetical protein n=1 Tax=Nocardia spumae TaxID=2887190 RepID=UPI001D1525EC|nr:hypothetical protein [Nocardia spumae]
MRRATGLRRRPSANRGESATPAASSDPNVDPPIVATLMRPLLALRASLGTGVATPNATISGALSNASTQAADTEGPHRDGVHALESTWTGPGSDATVPALRTTQTQIGDISDRGPAYLGVLSDAHATSARAAGRVDRIIADFRRDARTILGNASSAPDTDAVITRATQALRDAITTVTSARTEMDDHSRRLDEMGPLTVTTPAGLSSHQSLSDTPDLPSSYGATPGQYAAVPGQPGVPGQPIDPAQLAQLQLQQLLIQAGVDVGTSAINAGVDIGTHLIDKIAEVGTHTIDTVASSVDQAIPQLINPDNANGDKTNPAGTSGNSQGKLFDFGPGVGHATPGTTGPGSIIPGASPPAPDKGDKAQSDKADSASPAPAPAPMPKPSIPVPAPPPAPAPEPPAHPGGVAGGMALPPPNSGGQEHKPRDGQLGVTVPAAESTVPAAVIGDFGDDTV